VSRPLIKETPGGAGDCINCYLGSVTVARALAGLLFVALSVAPQRLAGGQPAEHQAIGRGGLISEFADHAGRSTRRERGRPADGSPPQQ